MNRVAPPRRALHRWAWLSTVVAVVVALFLVLNHSVVFAQGETAASLNVRDTILVEDGTTEIIVNLVGDQIPDEVDPGAFTVTENGEPVELSVEQAFETDSLEATVVLAMDVSGSMEGEPIELAREGAKRLIDELTGRGFEVQLLSFAGDITVLTRPTNDAALLGREVDGLEVGGRTLLYDAIATSIDRLLAQEGQANLVVFSDGEDNTSERSREDAIGFALANDVPINIVALESDGFSADAVADLAVETGGRTFAASEGDSLRRAFEQVAADLTSQYRLTYASSVTSDTLELTITSELPAETVSLSYVVPNVREAEPTAVGPTSRTAEPGAFAASEALVIGTVAGFAALLLLFALLFTGQRTVADRRLGEQLSRYIEANDRRAGRSGAVAAHFRDRAFELFETASVAEGANDRLTTKLEQAAWPLRNGEFRVLVFLSGLAAAMIGAVFFNLLGGLLLGVLCGFIPVVMLENRRTKRQDRFLADLPDTLQLMAGSLRAGYGVMQAVDTVAKEADGPTAEEFTRVLTEARLGMPVEDALEAMADRIDSSDLRWVVLAINIQREVGGNLAELLDTVAEVLREREMMRRQIKVLSAEGRLSAVILILLPILLAVYLVLVRPDYVGELVTNGLIGYLMIGGAVFLMAVGTLWIRNMIRIEV